MALSIIFVMLVAATASCNRNSSPPAPASPGPEATGTQAGLDITPEEYYSFELARLRLENEVNAQYLSLLKSSVKLDEQLEKKISELEKPTVDRMNDLKDKYKISFLTFARAAQDEASAKALGHYLEEHPETKAELDTLEQSRAGLDSQISAEIARLSPRPKADAEEAKNGNPVSLQPVEQPVGPESPVPAPPAKEPGGQTPPAPDGTQP